VNRSEAELTASKRNGKQIKNDFIDDKISGGSVFSNEDDFADHPTNEKLS